MFTFWLLSQNFVDLRMLVLLENECCLSDGDSGHLVSCRFSNPGTDVLRKRLSTWQIEMTI